MPPGIGHPGWWISRSFAHLVSRCEEIYIPVANSAQAEALHTTSSRALRRAREEASLAKKAVEAPAQESYIRKFLSEQNKDSTASVQVARSSTAALEQRILSAPAPLCALSSLSAPRILTRKSAAGSWRWH